MPALSRARSALRPALVALTPRRESAWLLVLAAIGWMVIFGRLGYVSLLDPDEAHYGQMTREMMRAHSWFVPLLDGVPFIDKPVLFHWLQMVSVKAFGESEFALRLPSAIGSVVLVGLTWWLGAEMFGVATGTIAAVMFATLPFTFALANVALFDMVYTAFLFGAVTCLLVAATQNRPRLQYVGYALLTLAVMTKGPVALLLVLLWAGVSAAVSPALRPALRRLQWPSGVLLVLVLASPWFIFMWVEFGHRFVRDYLLAGNLWYFTGPKVFSTRVSDSTFYLRTFAGAFFPWSLVAVGYGLDCLIRRHRSNERLSVGEGSLFLWMLVILGFFSLARFKLDWYIFPAAPACCLLAARGWQRAMVKPGRWTRTAAAVTGLVFVGGGIIAPFAIFRLNLGVHWGAIALPIALVAGGGILLRQLALSRSGAIPHVAIPVCTLLVAYATVVAVGLPVLERSRPTAPVGRWIRRHTPPASPIGVLGLADWRASIRFYADRPVTPLQDAAAVQQFLASSPGSYALMLRDDFEALRKQTTAIVAVTGSPMIVGRSGKYLRHQIWATLIIVTHRENGDTLAALDRLPDDARGIVAMSDDLLPAPAAPAAGAR